MSISLESIGLSEEELQSRVIERIADRLMSCIVPTDDGDDWEDTPTARKLKKMVQDRIDASISDLADKHILPNVKQYLETLSLQTTNKWGEAKGEPMTFIEYLTDRADKYMREEVNYEGKPQGQDSFSWKKSGTRIAWMVHQHLHYTLDGILKNAIANANSILIGGIQETCKIKLAEIAENLKVKVETM